ncbi:MAG: site-2 protease family protein [Oscillospiraceae bacterium]|nr:site-2 protease family protein [Oscillospiraceae bacterium]
MEFYIAGIKIRLTFLFVALLTITLLADRSGLVFFSLLAALIHETGHIAAFAVFKSKPHEASVEISGIKLTKPPDKLSAGKEVVLLFAGSAVNFVVFAVFFFVLKFESFAYIHLMIGVFNMLPIAPLDGGMLVKLAAERIFSPGTADIISRALSVLIIIPLIIYGIYLAFNMNFTLLITAVYLLILVLS